jgi:TRAP-type C4-dicarboxylate transport system permease small subunit
MWFSAIVSWRIRFWIMPATEISRALVYGACPVGSAFMLYYAVTGLFRHETEPLSKLEPEIHPAIPPTPAE